jgi:hypothetical protein
MHIEADTLDDLLRTVFQRLLRSKNRPSPTKGANREEIGALLTIRKPRARFSLTERRATLFSCLGETLWYLSGSDRLDIIEYYIKGYRGFSKLPLDATSAPGAYSFSSIAIIDAIKAFEKPVVEVHISNIHARDELHRHSKVSSAVTAVICGLGPYGYIAAMEGLVAMAKTG